MERKRKGFTLAELLIVTAIISTLTGISIPVFTSRLEQAKQAADLSNMRNAYTAAIMEWMIAPDPGAIYYYNGQDIVTSNAGIKGYGKSTHDAGEFSASLPVTASGIPNRKGNPGYITVKLGDDGKIRLLWGGAYAGQNVTSPTQYNSLSQKGKLKKDILLVDSIQDVFRSMTYGELRQLFMTEDGRLKPGVISGRLSDGNLCVTLSYSTINSQGQVVTGDKKTHIYTEDIFETVGFDTSLSDSDTYIINSVGNTTNTIWVNLRIRESDLKNLDSSSDKWNERAATAYTYVKSGGAATPEELREINRRN